MSPHTPPTAYRRQVAVSFAAFLFVVGFLLVVPATVQAETSTVEARQQFDLPAGSARPMLRQFAAQAKQEIVFDADTVAGFTTNAVKGEISAREALERMLAGTGLVASQDKSGAFAVRRETERELKNVNRAVAQDSDRPVRNGRTEVDANGEPIVKLDTFEVFGKKTLNMDIQRTENDALPYIVLSRDRIEASTATNLGEFITKTVPASSSTLSLSTVGTARGDVTDINLRGLGSGYTLILIDGRRAAGFALGGEVGQADLNSIPLSSVERVEILPASASGIYGGNAMGGVVNVVLKSDYRGFDLAATYDSPFRGSAASRRFDLSGGVSARGTSVTLSASYLNKDPLVMRDRDFYQRGLALILANNPASIYSNAIPPLGSTSNIRSQTGTNLTLKNGGTSLGSPFAYVPLGYGGLVTDGGAAFLATAGKYNFAQANTAQTGGGLNRYLSNADETKSGRLTVRQNFTDSWSAFVEMSGSENLSRFKTNGVTQTYMILATAANNPFNQNVRVTTPTFGADRLSNSDRRDGKAVIGTIVRFPSTSWSVEVDYSQERARLSYNTPATGISSAGSLAVTNGVIDLFRDTNVNSPDFGQYGLTDSVSPVTSVLNMIDLRAGGHLLELPAGSLDLSISLEKAKNEIGDYFNDNAVNTDTLQPARQRRTESAYAELRVPLFSAKNAWPGLKLLEVQLSARADDYRTTTASSVFVAGGVPTTPIVTAQNRFTSTVPTVGLRWSPMSDVVVRGSYSEGFLPPGLTQLVPTADVPLPSGIPSLTDARRGNAPLTQPMTALFGGTPDLKPESSVSRSLGIIISPKILLGLRLSVDWVSIRKTDAITTIPLTQEVLNNEEKIPGFVIRDGPQNDGFPVGPIRVINQRYVNVSEQRSDALDFGVDYVTGTGRSGKWTFTADATYIEKNTSLIAPGVAPFEFSGLSGSPKWSGSAGADWTLGKLGASVSVRYFGSYWLLASHAVSPSYGTAQIPSTTLVDLMLRYRFVDRSEDQLGSILSGATIRLGIDNIFDERPGPFLASLTGGLFDTRVDPRLRRISLSLSKEF